MLLASMDSRGLNAIYVALSLLFEAAALVLGICAWRSGFGKAAVMLAAIGAPAILMPSLSEARRAAAGARTAAEMRQLLCSLNHYADTHNGAWPRQLHNLSDADLSPYFHGSGVSNRFEQTYRYEPLGRDNPSPATTAVLVERKPVLGGGQYAGFADTHIEWIQNKPPSAGPEIERVVVSMDQAVVKQRRFDGEGMIITFGTMTNRWTPGSLYLDAMLDINLEWPWFHWHGANWVIKSRRGIYWSYRLDGPAGPMLGKIVFHPGTPAPAADGSYVIGEFRRDTEAEAAAKKADDSRVFGEFQPGGGQPIPIAVRLVKSSKPTAATPAAAQKLSFGPVIEHVVATTDADIQGLVFFDLETGQSSKPPFPLKFHPNRGPAFVDLTPELKQWIKARDVDLLLHLGDKSWDMMTLEMQEEFAGQLSEWETISPEQVMGVFAKKDADHLVRTEVPASSFGHSYREGFGACNAFRTRRNSVGVYQFEGVDNSTRRGVGLRYKLLRKPG